MEDLKAKLYPNGLAGSLVKIVIRGDAQREWSHTLNIHSSAALGWTGSLIGERWMGKVFSCR